MVGAANAATLYLANPTPDGGQGETSGSLVLAPGESGTMNIMLDTSVIDPAGVAFINAFFDQVGGGPGNCLDVTAVVHGQTDAQWTYDTSAYKLPAILDDACDGTGDEINEYGLVFGSSAGPGFPVFTNATYVIDSLTVQKAPGSGDSGDLDVFFEGGARKPQAFGPPPSYTPFTTNDFCLPPGVPGFLNMGVGNYATGCADAFDVTKIPEPAALSLLALGGLAALRRRR
jgi:hypothetical protein